MPGAISPSYKAGVDVLTGLQQGLSDVQRQFARLQAALTVPYTPVTSFEHSWVNLGGGFEEAAYLKDALGFVHLKGVVKGGLTETVIFTLPVGFRPGAAGLYTAAHGEVAVFTGGGVQANITSVGAPVNLSGITFLAEA